MYSVKTVLTSLIHQVFVHIWVVSQLARQVTLVAGSALATVLTMTFQDESEKAQLL